jgi:hypothetical protein
MRHREATHWGSSHFHKLLQKSKDLKTPKGNQTWSGLKTTLPSQDLIFYPQKMIFRKFSCSGIKEKRTIGPIE